MSRTVGFIVVHELVVILCDYGSRSNCQFVNIDWSISIGKYRFNSLSQINAAIDHSDYCRFNVYHVTISHSRMLHIFVCVSPVNENTLVFLVAFVHHF